MILVVVAIIVLILLAKTEKKEFIFLSYDETLQVDPETKVATVLKNGEPVSKGTFDASYGTADMLKIPSFADVSDMYLKSAPVQTLHSKHEEIALDARDEEHPSPYDPIGHIEQARWV